MKTDYWQKLNPGGIYHIYNRAVGKENLFITPANYLFFLTKWKEYLPYLQVYAYCLMPNHFHFLVEVKPLDEALGAHLARQQTVKAAQFLMEAITYADYLEDQFKRLFSSYALAYNKQEERHGALFQKRFKRIALDEPHRQLYILAYIHHNPIHHGFCAHYEQWIYSSWVAYYQPERPSLLDRSTVLGWFDENIEVAHLKLMNFHETFKLDHTRQKDCMED